MGLVSRRVGWAVLPIVVTATVLAVLPRVWFGDSPYTTSLAVPTITPTAMGREVSSVKIAAP